MVHVAVGLVEAVDVKHHNRYENVISEVRN